MTKSVYEIITVIIVEKLESSVVPWQQPWTNSKCSKLENTKSILFQKAQLAERPL